MGHGSNIVVEEATEMMNVVEVSRAIEWFKAMGISDTDACNFFTYIATGIGLPTKEPTEEKESN